MSARNPAVQERAGNAHGVEVILTLLGSNGLELTMQKLALILVANLAAFDKNRDRIVMHSQGLATLLTISKSDQVALQQQTARLFAQLSSLKSVHVALAESNVLAELFRLVSAPDKEVFQSVLLALANLAMDQELHSRFENSDVVTALLKRAGSESEDAITRVYAMTTITNLSANMIMHRHIALNGGVKTALRLLSSPLPQLAEQGAKTLSMFSLSSRALLVRESAVGPVLAALKQTQPLQVLRPLAATLANMAADDELRGEDLAPAEGLTVSLVLLKAPDPAVQAFAAAGVANFMVDVESRDIAVKHGAIPVLLSVLTTNERACPHCFRALAALCVHSEHSAVVLEAGALSVLGRHIASTSQDLETKQLACACVANLALNKHALEHIALDGQLLSALVHLTAAGDTAMKRSATGALANLCLHATAREHVIRAHGTGILRPFLQSDDIIVQLYGVRVAAELAGSPEGRDAMKRDGIQEMLVPLVDSPYVVTQRVVMQALTKLEYEGPELKNLRTRLDDLDVKQDDSTIDAFGPRGEGAEGGGVYEFEYDEINFGERIGHGAYGEVMEGEVRGKKVAIKRLLVEIKEGAKLTSQQKAFLAEIDICRKLSHDHLVRFYGATRAPTLCLVMELLKRGHLRALLNDSSIKIPWKRRVCMARQTANAMEYLHLQEPPIIHRDLKSTNLMLDDELNIKVSDLGVSRVVDLSHTMSVCGTPKWMSPEVIRGEKYTEKADVYSFGMVVWELCTRKVPYENILPMVAGMKVGYEGLRPEKPTNCPIPQFIDLMNDCLKANPTERPSFTEILKRLKEIEDQDLDAYA
eukprot:TRINITY_DN348_c1_g1_i6.p1 TRINITY_DN348_c1_g1~~TRINITY_DN348_c1_g1_i6.p1  ORF type:complete len:817 (-),score=197.71 TRINITY_DN348_c1_g1_i6:1207-3657(-)